MHLTRLLYPPLHGCLLETRPKHLAMGMALGVAIGGFPFGTPQWWIAVSLCVLLRAQPLLVLTGAGLSGLAVFCFPELFHWLGWRLLIPVPNLHPFWAWAYHLPLVPFTKFNETAALGRTVLTALAIPAAYAVTLRASRPWDAFLQAWVQDTMGAWHWRAEHSTLPPEPPAPAGWVRPHPRWVLGTVATATVAWYFIGFEPWFKAQLEASATELNAAPVKIRSLDFDLIDRRITIRGVEIGHPTSTNTNRFEVDELIVEFMATPLLYRKFVIKDIYTTGLHSNTHRSRWEELPSLPITKNSPLIDRVAAGVFRGMHRRTSPLNTLSQLKSGLDLPQTVARAKLDTIESLQSFERAWVGTEKKWTELLDGLPDDNWFANMDWAREDRAVAESSPALDAQREQTRKVRSLIEKKYTSLKASLDQAARPLPADLRHMRNLLGIPDLSQPDLTWDVFGREILNTLERLVYWVDTSRQLMPPAFERTRIPISIRDTDKGQVIHFHQGGGFATFLLINGELESENTGPNSVVAKGKLSGLTTNPPGWALPARIQLDAAFPQDIKHLKLDAVVDHTSTSPRESIRLDFEGVRVDELSLNQGRDLQFTLNSPDVSGFVLAAFSEDSLNLDWNVRFSQSRFQVESPYPELAQTLSRAVESVYDFTVKGRLEGPLDRLQIQATSQLGEAIATALRAQYRHALGAVDDNIRRQIAERTRPKREELASRLEAAYRTALGRLDHIDAQFKKL